jgi:hypothetical protein
MAAARDLAFSTPISRRAAFWELAFFLGLVLSYIWIWAHSFDHSWVFMAIVGLGFIVVTQFIHRERLEELGLHWRPIVPALVDAGRLLAPLVLVLLAAGWALGHWRDELFSGERFLDVLCWGFTQQYCLQSFIHRRLGPLIVTPWRRELTVGIIFGLLHLPNPVLVPMTFVAGWFFAVLFRRHPSLFALAFCHAVGSTAVAFGFPPGVLHKMRVGPRYFAVTN